MPLRRRGLPVAAAVFALPRPGAAGPVWLPATLELPAGPFLRGSSPRERACADALDAAASGSDVTRRQRRYEGGLSLRRELLPAFSIMRGPVTNAPYARFVAETGHRAPGIDPQRPESADFGPFDTEPVGSRPSAASPSGMLDAAGQVHEGTFTPAGPGRFPVEGGWGHDRGCGVCRPAARHGRPRDLRQVIVGFRLLREAA